MRSSGGALRASDVLRLLGFFHDVLHKKWPAARTAGESQTDGIPGISLARRIPSPCWPVVKNFSAAHDHRALTYPGLCRSRSCVVERHNDQADSVILKNETVDPSRARVSAPHGWGVALTRRSETTTAARSSLGLLEWIRFYWVSSFTCMGPSLTESPGWCQVIKRKHTWSPTRTNTTVCCAGGRVLEGITGTRVAASGATTA